MFQTSRKDWVELLALLRLVSDGTVPMADDRGRPTYSRRPLRAICRQEQQGLRTYTRDASTISITCPEQAPIAIALELWQEATTHAFNLLRTSEGDTLLDIDDAMEAFLDEIQLLSIGGTAEGQHHLTVEWADGGQGLTAVLSRVGNQPSRLLDGGRAANMKLEQTGTRFATPMAAKVNAVESDQSIRDRMLMVERMGSSLRYVNVADRVFRANLSLIDLHLGRLLTEMLRFSYMEDMLRFDELVAAMRVINPLKVSTELIEKHRYYEAKLQQLLLACLAGMRPGKIYTGATSMPPHLVVLSADGSPVLFDTADRETLAAFLLRNARLERGSTEKDKYGQLERENNVYYFKLNLKIGLTKR